MRSNRPMFAGNTTATLIKKEEIATRRLLDLELSIELELRRRDEIDKGLVTTRAQPNDEAYVSAFPFHQFVRETFPVIEQGREFKDNWHIDIICQLLQAVLLGQVKNFIINIPRRTMKSTLVCVMFPCWVWTFLPHLRFLYTSYSADFAKRDNEKCAALLNSAYYQQKWGDTVMLATARRNKLENTRGGVREVFKIGKGTGSGGDIVIGDDPNAIDEVESDIILDKTNQGWNEVSYHNVTDRNTASRGIIQQRTAPNDLTGNITDDTALSSLYSVLCLAMRYEADNPLANTPEHPLRLGKVSAFERSSVQGYSLGEDKIWIDPRDLAAPTFENQWYRWWYNTYFAKIAFGKPKPDGLTSRGEGQLLWETYITDKVVQEEVLHLKAYGESSQYQQRPIARGGNFFNSSYFELVSLANIELDDLIYVRVWDKAGSKGKGDWTVGTLLARTRKRPFTVYVLDIIRVQVEYYERQKLMKKTADEDYANYVESKEGTEYTIVIEKEVASAGKDISTLEKDNLLGYDVLIDTPKGKKWIRAQPVKSMSEAGRIKVIKGPWNVPFFRELEKYVPPTYNQRVSRYSSDHNKDDQIDTMSAGVKFLIFGNKQKASSISGPR